MINQFKLRLFKPLVILCFSLLGIVACSTATKYKSTELLSGQIIVHSAENYLGTRYQFGGKSPATGFDCSGLTWFIHKENNIDIPKQSTTQFNSGQSVLKHQLKEGDLVFFETYRAGASHVGIYKGEGEFIHAPNRNKRVQVQVLSNSYYKKRYLGARRYW